MLNVSGGQIASYTYDVFGNRRQAIRNGVPIRCVLDINGSMSQVLFETNGSNTPTAYYVYGAGLLYRIKADGTYHYYHFNNVGTTVAMTDESEEITHKYSYSPFGELLGVQETDFNPFRFVGQFGVMDEGNGIFFMQARYYDAEVGRFVSEDPIWDMNLYAYTNNNSTSFIDPKGESFIPAELDFPKLSFDLVSSADLILEEINDVANFQVPLGLAPDFVLSLKAQNLNSLVELTEDLEIIDNALFVIEAGSASFELIFNGYYSLKYGIEIETSFDPLDILSNSPAKWASIPARFIQLETEAYRSFKYLLNRAKEGKL